MSAQILVGDCREKLRELPEASVDSIVCDPPYHLTANKKGGSGVASVNLDSPYGRARIGTGNGEGGFMGMKWDGGDVAFCVDLWAEALRVLKPGGHLLAFSGTRTYHRMVVAIEDAGFEVRDQLAWVYGSGFPKSLDVSKAIDKAAGAEREVLGHKDVGPDIRGDNYKRDNGERMIAAITAPSTDEAKRWQGWGTALKPSWEPICLARKPLVGTVAANVLEHGAGALNIDGCRIAVEDEAYAKNCSGDRGHADNRKRDLGFAMGCGSANSGGRWPANLCHDGSDEVIELFPGKAGAAAPVHRRNGDKFRNAYGAFAGNIDEEGSTFRGDSGSAARFFYCAKTSKSERGEGNDHPTVKPQALMRWLCRLVTPPGGLVLDPFLGSGSTGLAALAEGFRFVGIELNPEYVAIAERRLGLDLA
jgi:site-specific DNA-methyltransferase (adenine-specific)